MTEEPLGGGNNAREVVRIGDTVHRARDAGSGFAAQVLAYLESAGYPYAPRYLGVDDGGRDILSYIPGQTTDHPSQRAKGSHRLGLRRSCAPRPARSTVAVRSALTPDEFTAPPTLACHIMLRETRDPEVVIAEYDYDARVTTTGRSFQVPDIQVSRVRNGQIVTSRDYHNHPALADAAAQRLA